jgi:NAD-dependent deacetylase
VWFGEMLPEEAVAAAQLAVARCDVFISVGTSSVVYPAAGFVHAARGRGAFTAEVNAEETVISSMVDVSLRGKSGDILPRVLAGFWNSGPAPGCFRTISAPTE